MVLHLWVQDAIRQMDGTPMVYMSYRSEQGGPVALPDLIASQGNSYTQLLQNKDLEPYNLEPIYLDVRLVL